MVGEDAEAQELVVAFFKSKGFQVTCYSEARDALKDSLKFGLSWDVLIADFNFKKKFDLEFSTEIKKILPNIPIIVITETASTETAIGVIQKGAFDLVVKPMSLQHLQIQVEQALKFTALTGKITVLEELAKSSYLNRPTIIGNSPIFLKSLELAKRVAGSAANIFITGESGTGKEVFAKLIHTESKRFKGPFVAINCSTIPENLLESELFGHAKGAFTGAFEKKIGLFEEAQNGTLFLDEIGDLSFALQAKLLRVLQEKKIKRVGENQVRSINCRIISATHKDLLTEIKLEHFREDLYFRLNVIPIQIPSLRERREDVLPLAELFLKKFAIENDSVARSFSIEVKKFIFENVWRGNVRELKNAVERAVIITDNDVICLDDFSLSSSVVSNEYAEESAVLNTNKSMFFVDCIEKLPTLDFVIQKFIEFAITQNDGARDKTAKQLGIDRKTLYKRVKSETLQSDLQS